MTKQNDNTKMPQICFKQIYYLYPIFYGDLVYNSGGSKAQRIYLVGLETN